MRSIERLTARVALAEPEPAPVQTPSVSVARFAGFDTEGRFRVELSGPRDVVVAISTIALVPADVGSRVIVAYEDDDVRRPVIMGRVHERAAPVVAGLKVDGERLVIRAEREIEFRCGEASIILTRSGKVLIRGNYVLTRSRGANRIKGAYVDIN